MDCAAAVAVAVVVVVVAAAFVVEDWRRKWERWILRPVHLVQLERGLGYAFQIVHGELLLLVTQCLLAGNDLWFFYAWSKRSLITRLNTSGPALDFVLHFTSIHHHLPRA